MHPPAYMYSPAKHLDCHLPAGFSINPNVSLWQKVSVKNQNPCLYVLLKTPVMIGLKAVLARTMRMARSSAVAFVLIIA